MRYFIFFSFSFQNYLYSLRPDEVMATHKKIFSCKCKASSENINAKCIFLGLAKLALLWFSKLHLRKSNKRVLWKAKRKWPSSALTSVSSLALSEWKLFVRVRVITALSCGKNKERNIMFFFFFSSWLHEDTKAGTSLPVSVTAVSSARARGTLTSSFHQSSGASWVLLTLSDLLKVTSGRFHLSSSPPNPFATHTYGGLQFQTVLCRGKKLNLYCSVPMGPDSWCVNDLNGLSHHVKLAMTFSLEQIEVRQQNYKCVIVAKINCSLLTS